MDRFTQKRVFITGAGSGLGQALSVEFAKMGWRVCVAEINADRAEETSKLVEKNGGQALKFICDVTKVKDIEKAAKTLTKEWGGVDVIFNNAGVSGGGYMHEIPLERWDWIMDINLKSVIYGCRIFIPLLADQGGGYIVNTGSYVGYIASPETSCYALTKTSVMALSEILRTELAPKNIDVSVIMPSFFKTNLMDQLFAAGERQEKLIHGLFSKTNYPPEKVAKYVIKSMKKRKLHIIPMLDARILWHFKRLFPQTYFKLFSFIYRKGIIEKVFGLDDV